MDQFYVHFMLYEFLLDRNHFILIRFLYRVQTFGSWWNLSFLNDGFFLYFDYFFNYSLFLDLNFFLIQILEEAIFLVLNFFENSFLLYLAWFLFFFLFFFWILPWGWLLLFLFIKVLILKLCIIFKTRIFRNTFFFYLPNFLSLWPRLAQALGDVANEGLTVQILFEFD